MGKFSPVTGGFITGNNSVYLYTGVQAEYDLGFLKVIPSFAPGYYEAGNGKDLGSALEFKSEIKFDLKFLKIQKLVIHITIFPIMIGEELTLESTINRFHFLKIFNI